MSTQFGNTDIHQEKGNQEEQKRLKSKYSNNELISLMVHVGIVFFITKNHTVYRFNAYTSIICTINAFTYK